MGHLGILRHSKAPPGLLVVWKKAAADALESRGRSRETKWVGSHVVFSQQMSRNSANQLTSSSNAVLSRLPEFFTVKKGLDGLLFKKGGPSSGGQEINDFASLSLFVPYHQLLDMIYVKNDIYFANVWAWVPWAVEKTKSQHIHYDLQSVCVYFLVDSFWKNGVSCITPHVVGSDSLLKKCNSLMTVTHFADVCTSVGMFSVQ